MTRRMYDAVDAGNIPTDAALVAGYAGGGSYVWSDSDWRRFPYATLVNIIVDPSINDGHVIDIEPGNWGPESAPPWAKMRRAAGVEPTVYTMASWWQDCIQAFKAAGEPQPQYWIAQWDGRKSLPDGAVAKQYANGEMTGKGYDLNVVADYWPGVDGEDNSMTAKDVWQVNLEMSKWGQDQGIFDKGETHWAGTVLRSVFTHAKDTRARIIDDVMPALDALADKLDSVGSRIDALDKRIDTLESSMGEIDADTTKQAMRDALSSAVKASGEIKFKTEGDK